MTTLLSSGRSATRSARRGTLGETSPALLGGHIDAAMAQPGEVKPLVDAKKLRVLAVASPQRHPFFPEAPTGKEVGLGNGIGTCSCSPPRRARRDPR